MEYHAHVYWNNDQQRQTAYSLRGPLIETGCLVGKMHESAIGPHPISQYQVRYTDANKQKVEIFLQLRAKDLTVMIHESTNDDVRDHTEGAKWIGTPLQLDMQWLIENTHRSDRRKL